MFLLMVLRMSQRICCAGRFRPAFSACEAYWRSGSIGLGFAVSIPVFSPHRQGVAHLIVVPLGIGWTRRLVRREATGSDAAARKPAGAAHKVRSPTSAVWPAIRHPSTFGSVLVRLANHAGRAALVLPGDRIPDVATASHDRFGPTLSAVYADWAAVLAWAVTAPEEGAVPLDWIAARPALSGSATGLRRRTQLPRARRGVGPRHADRPASGVHQVRVEFHHPRAGLRGAAACRRTRRLGDRACRGDRARGHRSVLTESKDGLRRGSDCGTGHLRTTLAAAGPRAAVRALAVVSRVPRRGLALVTPDELDDPDDIGLGCSVDGEEVQNGRTRDPDLPGTANVAALSRERHALSR